MSRVTTLCAAVALGAGLSAAGSQAALVSVLDRADALPDGVGYVQVSISDGENGAVDFSVEFLGPLLERAGDSLEIRAFAFNVAPGLDVTAANITGLPDKWSARQTSRMDGFGRFDMTLFGTGPNRINSLSFSIVDVEGDSPESYIDLSSGFAKEGHASFGARVRDMIEPIKCDPDRKCDPPAIPTAFVGGIAVPLPAGGLLAGTAALAAALFARRRGRLSARPSEVRRPLAG
jgi:hypothetical protein